MRWWWCWQWTGAQSSVAVSWCTRSTSRGGGKVECDVEIQLVTPQLVSLERWEAQRGITSGMCVGSGPEGVVEGCVSPMQVTIPAGHPSRQASESQIPRYPPPKGPGCRALTSPGTTTTTNLRDDSLSIQQIPSIQGTSPGTTTTHQVGGSEQSGAS